MAKKMDTTEISFTLKQGDVEAKILSIETVDKSRSIFEVEHNVFTDAEADVCIDYRGQHFCMPGFVINNTGNQLNFECKDEECMKARMFMQLLNIQLFKKNQSAKFSSIEGAAKVWVEEKAKAFSDVFKQ